MREKNYGKEFMKYASLNVLGMLGLSCYILADTFFVARGLGATGLAALNIAIPIYSFIHGCGLMLGMGGATKYSILKSQLQQNESNHVFTNTLKLGGVLAVFFFLMGLCLSGTIARVFGAEGEVFAMTKTYIQVILLFAPFFIFNNILLCFVRNDGEPTRSMLAMLGGSFSNIMLDYVFIFPLQMGIFGAVFATGLAPIISIGILSPYFIRRKQGFHAVKSKLSLSLCKNIFSGGVPSLVTEVSSGIVIIIFNMIILGLEGNTGVAAYGVIANLSLVVMAIYTGIAQGIQPILSKNYGARNNAGIRIIFRYALISVAVLSVLTYAGIFLGAEQIVAVFNSEGNILLKNLAEWGLKIYFIASFFAGCNIILSVYFTSTDNPKPAHMISILRGFVVIIPMSFLLSAIFGMTGVWLSFPVTELLVCIISFFFFLNHRLRDCQLGDRLS